MKGGFSKGGFCRVQCHAQEKISNDIGPSSTLTLRAPQPRKAYIDDRQITHLICVRLKHLLYDFFRGCFGPPSCCFSYI